MRGTLITVDFLLGRAVPIPETGCFIWPSNGIKQRYGKMRVNGKVTPVHRFMYERAFDVCVLPGIEVMHKCDIGLCINPNHLTLGTHRENMDDMKSKNRGNAQRGALHWTKRDPIKAAEVARKNIKATHKSGELNNNSRISFSDVLRLREVYDSNNGIKLCELGKMFGIKREQARKIAKRLTRIES